MFRSGRWRKWIHFVKHKTEIFVFFCGVSSDKSSGKFFARRCYLASKSFVNNFSYLKLLKLKLKELSDGHGKITLTLFLAQSFGLLVTIKLFHRHEKVRKSFIIKQHLRLKQGEVSAKFFITFYELSNFLFVCKKSFWNFLVSCIWSFFKVSWAFESFLRISLSLAFIRLPFASISFHHRGDVLFSTSSKNVPNSFVESLVNYARHDFGPRLPWFLSMTRAFRPFAKISAHTPTDLLQNTTWI